MNTDDRTSLRLAIAQAGKDIRDSGALRSALRRAKRPLDVIGFPSVDAFAASVLPLVSFRSLGPIASESAAEGAMIVLAQPNVLAVGQAPGGPSSSSDLLPRRFGERVGDQRRRLSELRLQKLLRAKDGDHRLQQFRRALALLDTKVDAVSAVLAWLDLHSEGGRRRFARAYFAGASPGEET